MTAEFLSEAMSFIDDEIIEDACAFRQKSSNRKKQFIASLTAVACICIAVVAILYSNMGNLFSTTPANEHKHGGGMSSDTTSANLAGSTDETCLIRIVSWQCDGFTGELVGENGEFSFYNTDTDITVKFTENTHGYRSGKDNGFPTEEDFPVNSLVEVHYSKISGNICYALYIELL